VGGGLQLSRWTVWVWDCGPITLRWEPEKILAHIVMTIDQVDQLLNNVVMVDDMSVDQSLNI
jgi:hypothetical protein